MASKLRCPQVKDLFSPWLQIGEADRESYVAMRVCLLHKIILKIAQAWEQTWDLLFFVYVLSQAAP